jgi:hypothetical protein
MFNSKQQTQQLLELIKKALFKQFKGTTNFAQTLTVIAEYLDARDLLKNFSLVSKDFHKASVGLGEKYFFNTIIKRDLEGIFGMNVNFDKNYKDIFFLLINLYSSIIKPENVNIKTRNKRIKELGNIVLLGTNLNFEELCEKELKSFKNDYSSFPLHQRPYMGLSLYMAQLLLSPQCTVFPSYKLEDICDCVAGSVEKACCFLEMAWMWYKKNEKSCNHIYKFNLARMTCFFRRIIVNYRKKIVESIDKEKFRKENRGKYNIDNRLIQMLEDYDFKQHQTEAVIILYKMVENNNELEMKRMEDAKLKINYYEQLNSIRACYIILMLKTLFRTNVILQRDINPKAGELISLCKNTLNNYFEKENNIVLNLYNFMKKKSICMEEHSILFKMLGIKSAELKLNLKSCCVPYNSRQLIFCVVKPGNPLLDSEWANRFEIAQRRKKI